MKTLRWIVTEDNGGCLSLNVFDKGKLIYIHTGYEHIPTQLKNDLLALREYVDIDSWEGNEIEFFEYDDSPFTKEIYDSKIGPIDLEDMGAAGRSVFSL